MKEQQAKLIAKRCAYLYGSGEQYTPKKEKEANEFEPHEWVVMAILGAVKQSFNITSTAENSKFTQMHKALRETTNELAGLIEMYNKKVEPWNYIDGQTCHENEMLLKQLESADENL